MLITNFASGELAENLFGRIDLPQYFQGVSHLENFDVVPTGGISRRRGTRRIMGLPEEGRIIPFIIDRDTHILLFLSPGKISVIVDGVITKTVESSEDLKLYETMKQIDEVQYAQNFQIMILVQENFHPIVVEYDFDTIEIHKFEITYDIEIIKDKSINQNFDEDDQNTNNLYLKTPLYYPKAATFVNGRLVFASTISCPQRLFFSKIGTFNNFSTYKKYITEQRDYVTIEGEIDTENDIVILTKKSDIGQFKKKLQEYYIESAYYPEDTMIAGMDNDNNIRLTRRPRGFEIDDNILNAFLDWKNNINTTDWSDEYEVGHWAGNVGGSNNTYASRQEWFYMKYRLDEISLREYYEVNDTPGGGGRYSGQNVTTFRLTNIKEAVLSPSDLYNQVFKSGTLGIYGRATDSGKMSIFSAAYFAYIQETLYYPLIITGQSFPLYGIPDTIYQQVLENNISGKISTMIPFYTKTYLVDRTVTPDDGFTFEIASDMSDAIKWIGQNKNLLVGTETAEWVIPAAVNATNIQAILNSRYGSDNVQGTAIGDAFCFIQTGKKAIVEYYIPQQDNNFRANNMAMLSQNMLHESPVFDFDFQSAPYTRIFISREDGKVACLLYERLTGTFAWGRITTTGHIRSVAVLPGDGQDEVYFVVDRDGTFFLERLDGRDEVYLDGFHTGNPGPGEIELGVYSGFSYTSRVRSMPILANDKMKNNVIKTLIIRFHRSYLPKVRSIVGVDREVQTDTIARKEPYSGVIQIPFPGQYDRDVFFEFIHEKPTACHILAVNAEAN
jgi:hypothetical protein